MFVWLGIALVVDAADGPLARHFRLNETLPRWSGETLDLVVDFLTYVFVPAYAIAASNLLPAPLDLAAGVVIVVTSGLYFADRHMKTSDNYFRGFPALWNCAAFYLLLLRPSPWLAASAVALLAILTFVPFRFMHPMRVKRLRGLTLVLLRRSGPCSPASRSPARWRLAPRSPAGSGAIGVYVLVSGVFRDPRKPAAK